MCKKQNPINILHCNSAFCVGHADDGGGANLYMFIRLKSGKKSSSPTSHLPCVKGIEENLFSLFFFVLFFFVLVRYFGRLV